MAPPPLLGSTDLWRPVAAARGGGWATAAALLLLASHLAVLLVRRRFRLRGGGRIAQTETAVAPAPASTPLGSASGIEGLVTEGDLRQLVGSLGLGAREPEAQGWEHVISKSNDDVSYKAWCDKPTAGPPKYLSITTYERCSTEQLRDFYMDNEYRMEWDSTVTKHEQLQYDENSGVEVGRTIKKFPLLTPREYILAWRVWEANDKSFYCFIKVTPPAFFELYILCASEVSYLFTRKKYIYNYLPQMFGIFSYATSMAIASAVSNIVQVRKKQKKKTYDSHEVITVLELMQNEECEHPLAARQRKFVRVRLLISGWCIRKIPGRDACQITVLHHEDNGMNIEMAKLAFSKGIWSYICKMNNALRRYPQHRTPSLSILTMQKLMKKFPQDLEAADANLSAPQNTAASAVPSTPTARTSPCKLPGKKSSRQMIASGLLLVGSIVCLSRGRSNLGAQLAMAFFLKKAFKQERIRLIDIKGENRRA